MDRLCPRARLLLGVVLAVVNRRVGCKRQKNITINKAKTWCCYGGVNMRPVVG